MRYCQLLQLSGTVTSINIHMKLSEILTPKTPSIINPIQTQDLAPQHLAPDTCVSAIAEGISQILRKSGGKLKTGFRCVSGPRKGRIVAKSATCNAKLNPIKGAKIRRKRQLKATQAGKKMAFTKRTNPLSRRLGKAQVGGGRGKMLKSKIVKPKK
jgi:hypothetical protein